MNAFSLAAGSNVGAGIGPLLQATTINAIQSYGAQQIKQIADRMGSEPARMAMHGILAGVGAAAQGGDVASAAMGASASVVLNNLMEAAYGQAANDLTAEERQACKNLVTSIICGSAEAMGLDPAMANTAATITSENNELLTATTIATVLGVVYVADKAYTAYTIYQDVKEIREGTKTLEQVVKERGEDYLIGILAGNLAKHSYKVLKVGGKWVAKAVREGAHYGPELATAGGPALGYFKKAAGEVRPRTHGVYGVNAGQKAARPAGALLSVRAMVKDAQLPIKGKIRFIPKKTSSMSAELKKGPNRGYIDKFDNEWVRGPTRTPGHPFEWDVTLSAKGKQQLGWASRDGKHINVSLDGKITH